MNIPFSIGSSTINNYFVDDITAVIASLETDKHVFITDTHLYALYPQLFANHPTLQLPPGEQQKNLNVVGQLVDDLLQAGADRKTTLIGVGGGVISDITGFVASVFMRGVRFAFIPTTLLAMVDAAIGGKNGVNIGLNKNIAGTISQPQFIIFCTAFLQTLTIEEWQNGFAEIIKYGAICDKDLFQELAMHNLGWYQQQHEALSRVIQRCAHIKYGIVQRDEKEKGERKLLNFGHTAGHAIETFCGLPHGQAVAIGMCIAARLSEQLGGLDSNITAVLTNTLEQYGLPVSIKADAGAVFNILRNDKKRSNEHIDYILLRNIGEAYIEPVSFSVIETCLQQCLLP